MWFREASPDCVAELLQNYERALGIGGKGCETGSRTESSRPAKNRKTGVTKVASVKSHEYFAQPGEAEWGC